MLDLVFHRQNVSLHVKFPFDFDLFPETVEVVLPQQLISPMHFLIY